MLSADNSQPSGRAEPSRDMRDKDGERDGDRSERGRDRDGWRRDDRDAGQGSKRCESRPSELNQHKLAQKKPVCRHPTILLCTHRGTPLPSATDSATRVQERRGFDSSKDDISGDESSDHGKRSSQGVLPGEEAEVVVAEVYV